jgi:peptidyl-Lys metalloendopeptidase
MRFAWLLLLVATVTPGCASIPRCKEVLHVDRCNYPGDELRCTLSVDPVVSVGEPVEVRFTLTNTTRTKTFHFIDRDTPLAGKGFDTDLFIVKHGGERLSYRGPWVDYFLGRCEKVPCDFGDSYRSLGPGETASSVVDLREGYPVDAAGEYRVSFRGGLEELVTSATPPYRGPKRTRPPGRLQRGVVDCNAVTVTVK